MQKSTLIFLKSQFVSKVVLFIFLTGLWTPSKGITLKVGFDGTTLKKLFVYGNNKNQFGGCDWAAFERNGVFLTHLFRILFNVNRSFDLSEFCTKMFMLVFCCAPRSPNFKMMAQSRSVHKIIDLCNLFSVNYSKTGFKGSLWKPNI